MNKNEKIKKILTEHLYPIVEPKIIRNKHVKIKDFFKKNQFIYSVIMSVLLPIGYNFYHSKRIFKYLTKDDIIINLGSGNKIIDSSIINLDIHKYNNVDIVGDIENLPFKDKSVDGIIIEETIEHLKDPLKAFKEMYRILKPGGILCVVVPFIFYYHESPDDYYRWTKSGLSLLLEVNNFKIKEFNNLGGPVGALCVIFSQSLAIVLSFNIQFIYIFLSYLFLLILSPLYILDFIFSRYRMASNCSAVFLVLAEKKNQ